MNSSKQKSELRRPGKPDLTMLDAKTTAFVEAGSEERAAMPAPPAPEAPSLPPEELDQGRIPKIPVSLRVPQNITDKVMELAAQETLKTKRRVTPHDIYLRGITLYLQSVKP